MEAMALAAYNSSPLLKIQFDAVSEAEPFIACTEIVNEQQPKDMSIGKSMTLFDEYHRDALKAPVKTHWIDGWKIEFLAFNTPKTAHLPPIVILGGAFQNFNSYKYWIEQLLEAGPVILIDLPAMGNNNQITNTINGQLSFDLELEEVAGIMGQWVNHYQLPKISIMGLSLGSVVATNFASMYPQKMDKLILTGVMKRTRLSWRMLLAESLVMLDNDSMEKFGQAVILYLINHTKLDKTKMSPTAKRLFVNQMAGFSENERLRYHINANRLLRLKETPSPSCSTLITTGEYDSFTLPFENANFALSCPNMQFAFIKNADHVPQLQHRKETIGLFAAFLKNKPLDTLDGIELKTRAQLETLERRSEPRVVPHEPNSVLQHLTTAQTHPINIVNMSYFGALLKASSATIATQLVTTPRDYNLHLTDADGNLLAVHCLMFEQEDQFIRVLFKHNDFNEVDRLLALLKSDLVQKSL